jgi:hypothetical protein
VVDDRQVDHGDAATLRPENEKTLDGSEDRTIIGVQGGRGGTRVMPLRVRSG